jgi:hypothetical protein
MRQRESTGRQRRARRRVLGNVAAAGAVLVVPAGALAAAEQPASAATGSTPSIGEPPAFGPVAVRPGQVVMLPTRSWVLQQLARPDLTPSERQWLQSVPVAVENATSATTAPAAPPGDPVAYSDCSIQDVFGVTISSVDTYVGFSTGTYKGQIDVTTLSVPHVYITGLYGPDGLYTWTTSQPGPPTPHMTGQLTQLVELIGAGYPIYSYQEDFNFWGTGYWTSVCYVS